MYTQQVRMYTSGVVVHYITWGSQSPNPQEVHCLDGNFMFDLRDVFQEANPDVKRDLHILNILIFKLLDMHDGIIVRPLHTQIFSLK